MLCWNDADRVLRILARLGELEPSPARILVIDNGSSADHVERIAPVVAAGDHVRLPRNAGYAAAVNRGVELALDGGADWIWLVNTDVALPSDALALLLDEARREPRCGMCAPVFTETDGRVQALGGGRIGLWTGSSRHVRSDGEPCDYLSGACLLVRASMLAEVGRFDEGYFFYWEDVDLGFRAREAGWTLAVAQRCRVAHDEGSTLGRWSAERWEHLFRGMIRFFRSHAPFPHAAVAWRLLAHTAIMLGHGRTGPVRGAWNAALASRKAR